MTLPARRISHSPIPLFPKAQVGRTQTQASRRMQAPTSKGCRQVMGVLWACGDMRRHNVVIQFPCRFPGNASEAGRWRFYRSAGREPTNRQHADRHDPLEPSQRPIRGECARPTVRGRALPSAGTPPSTESVLEFDRRATMPSGSLKAVYPLRCWPQPGPPIP